MSTNTEPTDQPPVRVLVAGPRGNMGRLMTKHLPDHPGITVVGGLSRADRGQWNELLAQADVLIDFTNAASTRELLLTAVEAGVRPVSGTSGVAEQDLDEIDRAARERGIGGLWAASFSLTAVLTMQAVRLLARHLSAAEIIELHHASKADSPSGTALALAKAIREAHGSDLAEPPVAHETVPGTRGGVTGGVHIHSLRLPNAKGWHDIVFTGDDGIVTVRHQYLGGESFVPPVAHGVRAVIRPDVVGLKRGYGWVLGFDS